MIFNLIPMIPLDGYIIIKGFLEIFFSYKKAFYISSIISVFSMGLFITYNEVFSLNNYLIISFLIFKLVKEIKNFRFLYWRFLMERYLDNFKYKKIKYHKKNNLDKLKKETYHYFRENNSYISEKKILAKKFDFK